ncbi:MAG: hypothetical protein ABSB18_03645 [Candidatus Omnitrophota bacterium]
MPINRKIFVFITVLALFSPGQRCFSQAEDNKPAVYDEGNNWLTFQSAYFTVYYKPDVNIRKVLGRISGRDIPISQNPPSYALSGIEAKLAYRLDMLFMRVEDVLGMHPQNVNIKIKIYKYRKETNEEFCYLNRGNEVCRAFYFYSHNTIYASEQDINDSVISHEMAHAAVDNYFSSRPPEKMAEILATNVDLHLDD